MTCDGTWSKRGFTACYGVVVVISWETGQVLDSIVLSKQCSMCKQQTMDVDSPQYLDWWETHKDSCNSNFDGSSPAMEAEGTSRLWARSVEKLKLRYTCIISDGDS